jgi:hypothetical protein
MIKIGNTPLIPITNIKNVDRYLTIYKAGFMRLAFRYPKATAAFWPGTRRSSWLYLPFAFSCIGLL